MGIVKDSEEHCPSCVNSNRSPVVSYIQSLPGLVEHFPLRQLPRSETGGNEEDEHTGNHEVLEIVLDQVEALAGRDPGAIEVEAVRENQDS